MPRHEVKRNDDVLSTHLYRKVALPPHDLVLHLLDIVSHVSIDHMLSLLLHDEDDLHLQKR